MTMESSVVATKKIVKQADVAAAQAKTETAVDFDDNIEFMDLRKDTEGSFLVTFWFAILFEFYRHNLVIIIYGSKPLVWH